VIFAELFSIYFILWAGHNYIDTEQLNPANHWTYLLSRCSVIGWFHVLFCLEFGVPSTTVKTTAYSGSIATLVHHSHQLKVFTFQPLKSQAPLHLDPLISHTLWHSSPDILTLSLEVSHLAVVVTGCCEMCVCIGVPSSSRCGPQWALLVQWEQVSCLISVHVHFRYCGLFTGDFLLGLFCDRTARGSYCYLWFPLRNLGAFGANRKPIWKTEHQKLQCLWFLPQLFLENWSLQTPNTL